MASRPCLISPIRGRALMRNSRRCAGGWDQACSCLRSHLGGLVAGWGLALATYDTGSAHQSRVWGPECWAGVALPRGLSVLLSPPSQPLRCHACHKVKGSWSNPRALVMGTSWAWRHGRRRSERDDGSSGSESAGISTGRADGRKSRRSCCWQSF